MASKKLKAADPAPAANDDSASSEVVALPAATPTKWELMDDANSACDGLIATVIDSPIMFELAAAELVDLQARYKEIEEKRFAITRPQDAAKKAVMDLFRPSLERLNAAINAHKAGMLAYTTEEKRKAALRQITLDKIAAQTRIDLAAEADRQAEESRKQSELAQQLLNDGDAEGANAALNAAETAQEMACALTETTAVVSAATAATNVPNVVGISTADVWKARVTDLPALLRFIADNPQYHEWVELKMTGLHDMAKAQRTELRVPGVEAFEEARIAAARTNRLAA